jgi:hypothetical protein
MRGSVRSADSELLMRAKSTACWLNWTAVDMRCGRVIMSRMYEQPALAALTASIAAFSPPCCGNTTVGKLA